MPAPGLSVPAPQPPFDLTTEVSNILPVANGGNGTASPSMVAGTNMSVTGAWPNQTIGVPSLVPLPYISGRWFRADQGRGAAGAVRASGTAYFAPLIMDNTITISTLGTGVSTLSASGNFRLAIYANNESTARPTGSALANTNNISTAATGTLTGALVANVQLTPNVYWCGLQIDNAVAITDSVDSVFSYMSLIAGGANASGACRVGTLLTGLTTALTFGTWGDLTSATWTEITLATPPSFGFLVASIP